MVSDKSKHWLNVVMRETPYVLPGTDGVVMPKGTTAQRPTSTALPDPKLQNGIIRYNTTTNRLEAYVAGSWQNMLTGNEPTITTVATEGNLPGISSPVDGDLATVLDNFATGEEAMYIWNSANADLGAPLNKWRQIATTEMLPMRVNFRSERITSASAFANIGAPAQYGYSPMITEINVDIIQAYPGGRGLNIVGDSGNIIMASGSEINPQLVGTYKKEIPGVNTSDPIYDDYILDTDGQVTAQQTGGTGGTGVAVVYFKYVVKV